MSKACILEKITKPFQHLFLILIFLTTKLWEKCEKYKNSQKFAKRQSERHWCFLETTGNLILIFLIEKKLKSDHKQQRYEEKCEKYKNSQKPAKKAVWPSLLFSSNDGKFNFDIYNWKNFENRTINTEDMEKNVKNIKIA